MEKASITSWKGFTLADAFKERPPKQYITEGIFAIPSLNIVYGSPGCLKSMLMADLVGAVLAGEPWLKPAPGEKVRAKRTTPVNVLWIDFDIGNDDTHARFEAMARKRGLDASNAHFIYYSMPAPRLNAGNMEHCEKLIKLIQTYKAELVIIDNLGTISGGADENSTAMVPVMANLRMVAEAARCCIIIIHHQRKTNKQNKGARIGESLRGSSSIEASLNESLNVLREDTTSPNIIVRPGKIRGSGFRAFAGRFCFDHKAGTRELETFAFLGTELPGGETDDELKDAILKALGGGALNRGALKTGTKMMLPGVGVNRIGNEIDALVEDGTLKMEPGDRTTKWYSVA